MIFRLSKLAHRLARIRDPLFGILVVILSCRVDGSLTDPDLPDSPTTNPPVASVTVSPASDSGTVGSSVQFTATVRSARGDTLRNVEVTWAVQDTSVAEVTTTGLVTYLSVGSTDVLASAGGAQGKGHVSGKPPRVWSVAVSPTLVNLAAGASATLTATALAKNGSAIPDRPATWRSSAPDVVSVNATGTVSAVGPGGGVIITATIDGKDGMATANVYPAPIKVVVVTPGAAEADVGRSVQFAAEARDSTGVPVAGRTFSWSSGNPGVASVSAQGVATGLAAGVAPIVATTDGMSDTAMMFVSLTPVATVSISPAAASLYVGGTKQLAAVLKDSAGNTLTDRAVTWSSSASAVASVNATGMVTAVGPGSATITATSEGQNGTAAITSTAPGASQIALKDGDGQTATAGTAVATPPSVIVMDQANNGVQGVTLTFAVTGGGGSITGATQLTGSDGVARVGSWTLGPTAGTNSLTATSTGLSGSPVTFTATGVTAPLTDVYFNSSEPGCNRSDPNALFCDDFESGFWYTVDADHIFTTGGGLAAQKGWFGNIYENPITPPGAAECGSKGFRSGCAATSGYMNGSIGGRNMAEHGYVDGAQLTEAWFRLYLQPQADYDGGHEKMFDFTRAPGTAQLVALCYNYFGSEAIRCIPYLHQDDGLPAPAVNAWMGSNMAPELRLIRTHWYFFEMHVKLNTPGSYDGVFEWWLNDCGTDGLACTGTPTLRGRYTAVKYRNAGAEGSVTMGANWIENWANPGSVGTLFYDNVRVAKAGPIGFAR